MGRKHTQYTNDDRKQIENSISNLKNEEHYLTVFEILAEDSSVSYTCKKNEILLNLSSVSDKTLDRVTRYIRKVNKTKIQEIETDVDIIPSTCDTKGSRTYKLSNYEKNILKHRNLKKVLNNDNEYQELKITPNKGKKSSSNIYVN